MKKIISLIALLIISGAATATAQWRYGFKFSGNFNTSKLSDAPGYSLKKGSGFRGGLMLEWQAPRCGFAFSAAALYNRNNARLEEAAGQLIDFGRDFLEIPLYAEYKFFMMKELFAPMVYTGPALMIALQSKDAPLQQHRLQPGWEVGVGFDIVNFIQITGGYRFGLGNALKRLDGAPTAKLRDNGWNIGANLLFDF